MQLPILEPPAQRWYCPNCTLTDVTHESRPHSRMHACAGLAGLTAPMVPAGTRAKVEAVPREDYVGRDVPHRDMDGNVVMAVRTTRDDGEDVAVLAPTASMNREELLERIGL